MRERLRASGFAVETSESPAALAEKIRREIPYWRSSWRTRAPSWTCDLASVGEGRVQGTFGHLARPLGGLRR
jgi:hypothetical protein